MPVQSIDVPPTLQLARARWTGACPAERVSLLIDAVMFARFTIRTPTARAEADFAAWIAAGRPDDVTAAGRSFLAGQCNATLGAIRRHASDLVDLASPELERAMAATIPGIGPAKACFAAACAGVGTLGCVDVWAERKHGVDGDLRGPRRFDRYLELVRTIWGPVDSAAVQWAEWLADRGGRFDHAVLI